MNLITRIAASILSRHAVRQRRRSVRETTRIMRAELGLPPLRALK